MASISLLSPTQKYAAGGLLALALRLAQIHQSQPFQSDEFENVADAANVADESHLWTHPSRGLLHPIFRFLGIEPKAWNGIEETAVLSPARHHIEAFLKILVEEIPEISSERSEQELALVKAVDAIAESIEPIPVSDDGNRENFLENASQGKEQPNLEGEDAPSETHQQTNTKTSCSTIEAPNQPKRSRSGKSMLEGFEFSYPQKVVVLFELLSACLADDATEDDKKQSQVKNGYDARHRVALRLLITWFEVDWIKLEAMEIMVACSVAAAVHWGEEETKETGLTESTWSTWKRGGIIGAAALTGGTLLAITGGLAAPAIAAGFSALAPTLGTLIPVIGASGFATAATVAGSAAGSVAVAASFGAAGAGLSGTKMARRIGSVEEFEFRSVGENNSQGRLAVGIFVSGLVFEQEDFTRPWEGQADNLERYAVQWESENLIAVSTAIQDWITSKLTYELMKQGAMVTVLGTLVTALAWPASLLAATDMIDSKWSIAIDRSEKAGKLLAEVLIKGLQGNRPVSLYGFSLGARVIFKCLQHLAEVGNNEGIVERVVLLGAPISVKDEDWEGARKMVAGRFVNVYATNDWMLAIAFRASLITQGLAGIQPIDVPGIENVDMTKLIEGHSSYLQKTKKCLELLDLDAYYPVFPSPPSGTL